MLQHVENICLLEVGLEQVRVDGPSVAGHQRYEGVDDVVQQTTLVSGLQILQFWIKEEKLILAEWKKTKYSEKGTLTKT